MNITETIQAIHVLACLRHFDVEPRNIQVVIGPWTQAGGTVEGSGPGQPHQEVAERCQWSAQVRLGGGQWGHNVGPGDTVEEALTNLLRGYVRAHEAVDERRAEVFARLPALTPFGNRQTTTAGNSEFSIWAQGVADRMSEALERNRHKGGRENWLRDDPSMLVERVADEFHALAVRVREGIAPEKVWAAAASVANMAAMTADAYASQRLGQSERSPTKGGCLTHRVLSGTDCTHADHK